MHTCIYTFLMYSFPTNIQCVMHNLALSSRPSLFYMCILIVSGKTPHEISQLYRESTHAQLKYACKYGKSGTEASFAPISLHFVIEVYIFTSIHHTGVWSCTIPIIPARKTSLTVS